MKSVVDEVVMVNCVVRPVKIDASPVVYDGVFGNCVIIRGVEFDAIHITDGYVVSSNDVIIRGGI